MSSASTWLALIAASGLGACSLVAIQRAPSSPSSNAGSAENKAATELSCTDELTYPLIDTVGTILAGALTVSLLSSDNKEDLKVATYSSAALGVGLVASAIYGIFHVQRCRRAQQDQAPLTPGPDAPDEDREPPGTHGGACKADGECDVDLFCDEPMQVCLPLRPSGEDL
jgi:hypothetical protein